MLIEVTGNRYCPSVVPGFVVAPLGMTVATRVTGLRQSSRARTRNIV
jgi:hypothetical protein